MNPIRVSAGVLFLAAAGSCAPAQTQRPTFYGFVEHDPVGTAGYGGSSQAYIDELDFIQQIHIWMDGATSYNAATVATAAYNDAHLRMVENGTPTLRPGRICIRIQNLAASPDRRLWTHPDDAVRNANGTIYTAAPHAAPWFSNGITELESWMTTFTSTYASLSSSDALLRPNRFHLDEEPDTINPYSNVTVQAYLKAIDDPAGRWSSEYIPGFKTSLGLPMTLADIYAAERTAFGLPTLPQDAVDSGATPIASDQNRKWYLWWSHVWLQAFEGAMNEAVYEPIRAAFPPAKGYDGCLVSNYASSADTDGQNFAPYRDSSSVYYRRGQVFHHGFTPVWTNTSAGTTWYAPWWRASADMYAPVLYDVGSHYRNVGPNAPASAERNWDAALRNHRVLIDCVLQSGGSTSIQDRAALMAPWICLPGMSHITPTPNTKYTRTEIRDQLALLRAKAVPEVNVFWTRCAYGCGTGCNYQCPDQPSMDAVNLAFDDFRDVFRQAYGAQLGSYTVEKGSVGSPSGVSLLHFSHSDPLVTIGEDDEGCLTSQILGTFSLASPGGFPSRVNLEISSDTLAVNVHVYVVRNNNTRDELIPYPLTTAAVSGNGVPSIKSYKISPDAAYVSSTGEVKIVVEQQLQTHGCDETYKSFSTKVDLLQLVPLDCPADIDDGSGTGHHDGGVDIADMLYFLEMYELGDLSVDLDDGSGNGFPDGGVDLSDYLYYLNRFEAGC